MTNHKYFKIKNKYVQTVQDFMDDNKISYVKYNNLLKAICDEEAERMLDELRENYENNQRSTLAASLIDHKDKLSSKLFENDNDLLDSYHIESVFDDYLKRNDLL